MIQLDVIKRLDNGFKELYIFINDKQGFLNIEFYKNKYNEEVLKIERNSDTLKICNFKKQEIQKSILYLLDRDI